MDARYEIVKIRLRYGVSQQIAEWLYVANLNADEMDLVLILMERHDAKWAIHMAGERRFMKPNYDK